MILFFFSASKRLIRREEMAKYLDISLRELDHLVARGFFEPRRLGDKFELPEVIQIAGPDRAKPDQNDTSAEAGDDDAS